MKCPPGYEECHHFKVWWCLIAFGTVVGYLLGRFL